MDANREASLLDALDDSLLEPMPGDLAETEPGVVAPLDRAGLSANAADQHRVEDLLPEAGS